MTTTLTPQQLRAVEILLTGSSITDAAKSLRISRTTLHSWLNDELFRAELNDSTSEILDATVRQMTALSSQALGVLAEIMLNKKIHPSSRLRAAEVILTRLMAMRDSHEFAERLTALEKRS